MKKDLIYLTGFMGAGKSTIGPVLANALGWDYCDLDNIIERKEGKSINKIFEEFGEIYFRQKEREEIIKLSQLKKIVVSLGGGAVANEENFRIIKNTGSVIFLEITPETAYERLKYKTDRPLFLMEDGSQMPKEKYIQKIKELLNKRNPYYEKFDFKVDMNKSSFGLAIDEIVKFIEKEKNEKN